MVWRCIRNKGDFLTSCETPIKNGQQVNKFLPAILLLPDIAVLTIETHAERTEPEHREKTLADFHAKAAAPNSKDCGIRA